MQRYFAKDINNDIVILSNQDMHHIKNVMRMSPNDNIEVVYSNTLYQANITDTYQVKINKKLSDNKLSYREIILASALIKEQKQDIVFQKSTELGVNRIIPLSTSRCVVKIDKSKEVKKKERWGKICKEASEQSKRIDVPIIDSIMTIKEICNIDADLKIVLNTKEEVKTLKNILINNQNCNKIIIVVGPEGGFTTEEVNYLEGHNFISVSIGEKILRAETACISVLSMINYHFMR